MKVYLLPLCMAFEKVFSGEGLFTSDARELPWLVSRFVAPAIRVSRAGMKQSFPHLLQMLVADIHLHVGS